MHNMSTSFEASHQSSHDDTRSRHDTPKCILHRTSQPVRDSIYSIIPPNMAFEATKAFPFDRAPTSSRHFNASPIMMNLFGSTSTHDGGMRDIDDIQREDAQNPADVGHSNVPLALNRNVRVVKRTRCETESHYLGSDYDFFFNYNKTFFSFYYCFVVDHLAISSFIAIQIASSSFIANHIYEFVELIY
ncbi:hypothetical protein Scep_004084 [Stephania cephalantha]|uniref:Uncharacterized protein n=1 Tax=Stephania cephalantha TaxID=152367 RepID=A0AAP0PWC6_9MAGN